jgi:23S rRNA (cytosine1962-C5)-methyltransferase
MTSVLNATRLREALRAAWTVRGPLHAADLSTYRLLDGAGDGVPGLYLDRYGPAVVCSVYDDARLGDGEVDLVAASVLEQFARSGIESVYVKPFARDRSRLGGQAPPETRGARPRAGRPQPETILVREYSSQYEVQLYDGFSTGLFLDHREHRRALAASAPARTLNLFAYTCAFAVPLTAAGGHVTNVDVSSRYLDWGRRNLAYNQLPAERVRYYRMDAMEFLAWASRRADERFDLVILDPPTFAAGDARRGRKPWKATSDYPALVQAAGRVLAPGGRIFTASNARELALPGALERTVTRALGRAPSWQPLPPWPIDVREPGRVAALLFQPR